MESGDLENQHQNEDTELKIVNKIIGCNLHKNIKGTIKYTPENKSNLIVDIKTNNFHKRIFYKNEQKEFGYIEVFQNLSLTFSHELSENISFLFECDFNNNQRIDNNKCFGYRYYGLNNNYCTLLKLGDENEDDYFFLEKLNEEENEFYDKSLDCFQIIFYSIFSRYKKNENLDDFDFQMIMERPLYEILGFCYSTLYKSNDKFQFHKIHSINLIKIIDFTSHIKKDYINPKLNIMPILFDGHISLLLFYDEKDKRNFILSDPSLVHSRFNGPSLSKNPLIFPESIRTNLNLFPKIKIQAFNSCLLWYYFQILCFINYNEKIQSKKYNDIKICIDSIKDYSFYLDCFEYYRFIMGFEKPLFEINPNILFDDEDYFYIIAKFKYISDDIKIHKFCFLNQFVDFIELLELKSNQEIGYKPGIIQMKQFRKYNEELIDFIIRLNYNLNILQINEKKDISTIKIFQKHIFGLKDLRNHFIKSCIDFLSYLSKVNIKSKSLEKYNSEKLKKIKFDGQYLHEIMGEIRDTIENFYKIKNELEGEYDLYSLEITGKILYPMFGFLYKSK